MKRDKTISLPKSTPIPTEFLDGKSEKMIITKKFSTNLDGCSTGFSTKLQSIKTSDRFLMAFPIVVCDEFYTDFSKTVFFVRL